MKKPAIGAFTRIFDTASVGACLVDNLGCILEVNPAVTGLLGYEKEELLGSRFHDYCTEQYTREITAFISGAGTGDRDKLQIEAQIRHIQGNAIWFEIDCALIRNKKREPEYYLLQLKDISARKATNEALLKQTALNRLLGSIALASNDASTFDDALQICLDQVCEYTGWPLGHAYLVEGGGKRFVVRKYRYPDTPTTTDYSEISRSTKYKVAAGLPGRVWRTRRPTWIRNFDEAGEFSNAKYLAGFGLKAGFAFPIFARDEIVAVLEFFCDKVSDPDFDFLEVMVHIGIQLSHVVERERAQRSLQLSEEKFSTAFRSSPDAISILSISDRKFVEVNESFLRTFAYRRHEIIGKNTSDMSLWRHPEQEELLVNRLRDHGMVHNMEADLYTSTDKIINCLISAEIIKIHSAEHVLVLTRDITEKLETTAALKRSEGLLRSYFNAGFVGMAIISPDNRFLHVNDTVGDIFGYTHRELLGMNVNDLSYLDDGGESVKLFNSVVAGEIDGYSQEKQCVRKDGGIITVSVSTESVSTSDGAIDYLVAFYQDITKRKLSEIALYHSNRALRVLNECTHTIVHATSGQEMINAVCRIIVDTGGYRFAWVGYAQSDEAKTVYPVAHAGYEVGYLDNDFSWDHEEKRTDPVSGAITTGRLSLIKDLTEQHIYGALRNAALERGYRSEIALPLNVGNRAFGALMIYAAEPDAFDGEEVNLLTSLAEDLAFGILSLHTRAKHERAGSKLKDNESNYQFLYEENPAIFFTLSEKGIIRSINKYGAELLGYRVTELTGKSIFELTPDAHRKLASKNLKLWLSQPDKIHVHEQQKVRHDGELVWLKETARTITDREGQKLIIIVGEDITDTRKRSDRLAYQATHDTLTGLINRHEFEERLSNLLASTRTDNAQHALCYLDLDQIRMINDTCGHIAGDELLRQLGALLLGLIRKRDTVARLGGDEFVILMEHCPLYRAESIARKIIKAIGDYHFVWDRNTFKLGVSIGLVPINNTSGNVIEILNDADQACYTARDLGYNRLHIAKADAASLTKKHGELRRLEEIQGALAHGGFQLYFQVIEPLRERRHEMDYYEVLLRMETDSGELLQPDAFMPVAEHYNESVNIDKWVINRLFSLISDFQNRDKNPPLFFVNLSGHSLGNNDLLELIVGGINSFSIPPEKICFEITETVAIANMTHAVQFINILRECGCYFALDDFGSGLSSYAYLKNLHVDFLKIDGFFVKGITNDPVNLAIVKSMHEIGRALGKFTIAESVEDKMTCEKLRHIGLDYVQGNYIGHAQSMTEISRPGQTNIIEFTKRS